MPFNFGAFAGGLASGLERGQKMRMEAEAHKLKAKMLKLQSDAQEFDQQEKIRKAGEQAQQQIELGKYVDMVTGGVPGQPPAPLAPGAEGPTPEPGFQVPNRPASQQELFGQSLKATPREHQYQLIQQQMKGPSSAAGQRQMSVGVGGTVWDPVQGKEVYRNPTERVGVGVESQMLAIARKMEAGTATPEEISLYSLWPSRQKEIASARGEGAQEGALKVKKTPEYLQNQANIETAQAGGRPLETPERQAIGAMESTVRVARELKQNFTPEDLNKYVGYLKFPANRIGQLGKADPKFAQFQTLINQVKGTAFSEGGKQLTPFEAGITFGHIPTGTEFSTADFVAKLDNTLKETQNRINDRLRMSTQPRSQVRSSGNIPPPPSGWRRSQ